MPTRIHAAILEPGASGTVIIGRELDLETAIAARKLGNDVIVCGEQLATNRNLAKQIESRVGPYIRHPPHLTSGSRALPHFQQLNPPPIGHTFYESDERKGRIAK